ncbi:MAG TPA: outer membrane beta-barrel protein [Spirochaetota bacterium]|nr:outer membrane beta-barrel protein [Spirochaetota bacterium]HPS87979.1 outer membrane beta-barrel protein [Spirochaetota bacterium]
MKKTIINICVFTAVLFLVTDVSAASSRKKYFSRPQIGLWYGPVTPILDTGEHVESDLGGGAFFRYNLPYDPLKLGIDSSYQYYDSKGVDRLRLIPVYFNLLYLLPIDLPIRMQLKAGAGMCQVYMEPDETKQWDPMFMAGTEISFPAGKMANIALRIDYLCIYEEYLDGATKNGHVINAGVSLYFNLNL